MSKQQQRNDDDDDDAQLTGTFLPWTGDGNALPNDVLKIIFDSLIVIDVKAKICDIDSFLACRLVCHRWCNVINLHNLLRRLDAHLNSSVAGWKHYTYVKRPIVKSVSPWGTYICCVRCGEQEADTTCCYLCLNVRGETRCTHLANKSTCCNIPCLIGSRRRFLVGVCYSFLLGSTTKK